LPESSSEPSLVILFGENGIGKTTLLQMLDGLLGLDFDIFRTRPFRSCTLRLTTGQELSVATEGAGTPLTMSFDGRTGVLDPRRKGALDPKRQPEVDELSAAFREARSHISFQFIPTARTPKYPMPPEARDWYRYYEPSPLDDQPEVRLRLGMDRLRLEGREGTLGSQVRQFIQDAQGNYRRFFATESALFERILRAISGPDTAMYDANVLKDTIDRISRNDETYLHLGIRPEEWDYKRLTTVLASADLQPKQLAVLGAYIEGLDARAAQKQALVDRLLTFESVMTDFLKDKTVMIDDHEGLRIETATHATLREDQLSSGEFHLLYLMVAALVATRRGTLIAIDEPEMSMHISWQTQLISSLLRCASNARPQLVLATHSPDVTANYRQFMVGLGS